MEKIDVFKNISLTDLPNEKWKPLIGYEGIYEVSSLGRVKSLSRFREGFGGGYYTKDMIRKQKFDKNGYLSLILCKSSKQIRHRVHRLTAIAFIENPEHKPQVNHKNNIRHDNSVLNLEWSTNSENINHCVKNKRHYSPASLKGMFGIKNPTSIQVLQLDSNNNLIKEWSSLKEITTILGFNRDYISKACKNTTYIYGFYWQFKNEKNNLKMCDLEGNLIKEWDKISTACKDMCISSKSIFTSIKTGKASKGYIWKK